MLFMCLAAQISPPIVEALERGEYDTIVHARYEYVTALRQYLDDNPECAEHAMDILQPSPD